MQNTTRILPITIACLCACLFPPALADEPISRLGVGDPAPRLSFVDIEGRTGQTQDYFDRIVVYSFADRKSSERLTAWMRRAGVEVLKAHPELRMAYVNFADVQAVPRAFRAVVAPILRHIDRSSQKDLAEAYEAEQIKLDPNRIAFHMIPDWDGAFLTRFGLEHAKEYHCWIAAGGRIVAAFDESTPDIHNRYVRAIEGVRKAQKGGDAESPARDSDPDSTSQPESAY